MDAAFVDRVVQTFEHSSLSELEYVESNGDVLRLKRGAAGESRPPAVAAIPSREAEPTAEAAPAGSKIVASFGGMFYRGPSPGQPAFVSVGDMVSEGQTIGILEAMKVLNRVEADLDGRITDIPAADGAAVEAGATLFVVTPS